VPVATVLVSLLRPDSLSRVTCRSDASAQTQARAPERASVGTRLTGLSRDLSERWVAAVVAVSEVSELARRVGAAHRAVDVRGAMAALQDELPHERPYVPQVT
jgi:hypothetical protein